MKKLLAWQCAVWAIVTIVTALAKGSVWAHSAFLGGFVYVIPSVIAVVIFNRVNRFSALMWVSALWAQSVKVLSSLLLMIAVFILWPAVAWAPFILGLIAVSHVAFFVFGKMGNYGNRTSSKRGI